MGISQDFRSSLIRLDRRISQAERQLSELSAASVVEINLSSKRVRTRDKASELQLSRVSRSLVFRRNRLQLLVEEASGWHDEGFDEWAEIELRPLTELPIAQRIEAARKIPELIDEVSSASDALLPECDAAIDEIDEMLNSLTSASTQQ